LVGRDGSRRLIAFWSSTILPGEKWICRLHYRNRNRHHRAQTAGEGKSSKSAPPNTRRIGQDLARAVWGNTLPGFRIHEQGSGTEARRGKALPSYRSDPGFVGIGE